MKRFKFSVLCMLLLLFAIFLVTADTTVSNEDSVTRYFWSNSIGLKMQEYPTLQEVEESEWYIVSIESVFPGNSDQETVFVQDRLYHSTQEVLNILLESSGNTRIKTTTYADGNRQIETYLDGLLVTYELIETGGVITRQVFTYFMGELLRRTTFRDGIEQSVESYVRKADGSLHLRQKTTKKIGLEAVEIIIFGSDDLSETTVIGRKGDFSLLKELPNGVITTEQWVGGVQISGSASVENQGGGEYILSEKHQDGSETVKFFSESGVLYKQIENDEDTERTIDFSYNDSGNIESKTITEDSVRTIIQFTYKEDGRLESESEYENGMISRVTTYSTADSANGKVEQIYNNGKLFLTIQYEPDNRTVRNTELAGP